MPHPKSATLRLSAQRALLGAITPDIRLIKIRDDGTEIALTTIVAAPLDEHAVDVLSVAAAEILSDFPDRTISEIVTVDTGPLPREDVIDAGWVYRRAE